MNNSKKMTFADEATTIETAGFPGKQLKPGEIKKNFFLFFFFQFYANKNDKRKP